MSKIKAGDILICKEYVSFDNDSFHYEGQLLEVKHGEEYYFNTPCNRLKYDLDRKNQKALKNLYYARRANEGANS